MTQISSYTAEPYQRDLKTPPLACRDDIGELQFEELFEPLSESTKKAQQTFNLNISEQEPYNAINVTFPFQANEPHESDSEFTEIIQRTLDLNTNTRRVASPSINIPYADPAIAQQKQLIRKTLDAHMLPDSLPQNSLKKTWQEEIFLFEDDNSEMITYSGYIADDEKTPPNTTLELIQMY